MALNRSGYTITETLVTVAIVATLAGIAAPILTKVTNFWRQTSARGVIERDVRVALDTINRFARQAKATSVQIDRDTGQPPCSRLTFLTIQGDFVQFYQQGNKLWMKKNTTTSMLTENVAYIAFVYPRSDDVSLLSVAITTQASTYLGAKKALQLSIQKVRIMN